MSRSVRVRNARSERRLDGPDGVGAVASADDDRERTDAGTLVAVVGRRDGADAVRAVEAAL